MKLKQERKELLDKMQTLNEKKNEKREKFKEKIKARKERKKLNEFKSS